MRNTTKMNGRPVIKILNGCEILLLNRNNTFTLKKIISKLKRIYQSEINFIEDALDYYIRHQCVRFVTSPVILFRVYK